jgi:hypothetical protein
MIPADIADRKIQRNSLRRKNPDPGQIPGSKEHGGGSFGRCRRTGAGGISAPQRFPHPSCVFPRKFFLNHAVISPSCLYPGVVSHSLSAKNKYKRAFTMATATVLPPFLPLVLI